MLVGPYGLAMHMVEVQEFWLMEKPPFLSMSLFPASLLSAKLVSRLEVDVNPDAVADLRRVARGAKELVVTNHPLQIQR
jgi:hypothetical protein